MRRFVYCSTAAAAIGRRSGTRHELNNESRNMWAFEAACDLCCEDCAWAVFSKAVGCRRNRLSGGGVERGD